jgi:hypothetical protein
MARVSGHKGFAEVGANEIGERISFELETSVNELEGSTQGNDWTDTDPGQLSASGTIEVYYDYTDAGQTAMVVGATVALKLYPASKTDTLEEISGNFLVTSKSQPVPVGDNVKVTYGIKNKGTITSAAYSSP